MDETLQRWIAAHPYLKDLARFQAVVEEAVAAVPAPTVAPARLEAYAKDHASGVPLLHSGAAAIDLAPAGDHLARVVARVADAPLPGKLRAEAVSLRELLRASPPARREAVAFLRGEASPGAAADQAGLLRFLGWAALRASLAPLLRDYAAWREAAASAAGEDPWMRGECPTCGARPAMAQLSGGEDGRRRSLACGCCGTTWSFRRTGCPSCGEVSPDRLRVLELAGEERVRLDTCDSCGGYLKTYVGNGEEEVFLADWTTLHLDVLARERGLKRVSTSLYDL
ncbi:MAG TPA: formate dehydrogenase accessory protein FdhE [Anaeromyxobacteraceae bacterium]